MKKTYIAILFISIVQNNLQSNFITDHPILTSLIAYNTLTTGLMYAKNKTISSTSVINTLGVSAIYYNSIPNLPATAFFGLSTYALATTYSLLNPYFESRFNTWIRVQRNRTFFENTLSAGRYKKPLPEQDKA